MTIEESKLLIIKGIFPVWNNAFKRSDFQLLL